MGELTLSGNQRLTADLAHTRQTLDLLRSHLRTGDVERDYWLARVEEIQSVLANIANAQESTEEKGRLAALFEISKALGSSLDVDQVLTQVMDSIIQLTGAERGFLMLLEDDGELAVKAARNMDQQSLEEEDFAISRTVIREVAATGEQVVTTNATEDPRFAQQASVVAHNLRSIQCVPMLVRGRLLGVIYVDNRIRAGVFNEEDLSMLTTFAGQAAIAIENARLFTQTDQALAARVEELSMMQEIDRQLNETLDFGKVMSLTLSWAVKVTEADNGAIGIIDLEKGDVQILARHGETPSGVTSIIGGDTEQARKIGGLTVPIQREGRVIGVITLDRKDDRAFTPEAHAFVLRLAEHAAIAIENAQLYEAVKRANEAKSEFVSVVTHELRIPMTGIKGYADMLGLGDNLTEKQHDYLNIIHSNVTRMNLLVSDLSDVSRIETGRMKLDIEDDVSISEVLDEIVPTLKAEIDGRQHELKIDVAKDVSRIEADSRRLGQIFTNLISNAYKYTPDGGTIMVRASRVKDSVRCEVADTGIGMTPDEVNNLFTKFWRSDETHVRDESGTGLGLVIAKNLVELHGGTMDVTSEKDVGTTFSFLIPVKQG